MRFTFAFVALSGIAAVSASNLFQRQSSFPTCADACLEDADTDGCTSGDDSCLCNKATFVDSVTDCIESACSGSDLTDAIEDAVALCEAVGVTLTGSVTATATASSSATATGSVTTTGTSTSSTAVTTATSGGLSHGANALAGLVAAGAVALVL